MKEGCLTADRLPRRQPRADMGNAPRYSSGRGIRRTSDCAALTATVPTNAASHVLRDEEPAIISAWAKISTHVRPTIISRCLRGSNHWEISMKTRIAPVLLAGALVVSASAAAAPASLRYYVGRQVAVVEVTTTVTTTRRIIDTTVVRDCLVSHGTVAENGVVKPAHRELCVTDKDPTTIREGAAGLQVVPDSRLGVSLTSTGGGLTDDQQTVELRDGMLLKSINVTSVGRAGEILTNVVRFVGVILGGPVSAIDRAPIAPGPPVPVSGCDPFDRRFKDLPDTARLWIWENADACAQWQQIAKLQDDRKALVNDRTALEKQIRSASQDDLAAIYQRLDRISDAIEALDGELKRLHDAFDKPFAAYAEHLRLGAMSETSHHHQVLELTDLPSSAGFEVGMDQEKAKAAVETVVGKDAWKRLWENGRVLITLDSGLDSACAPVATVPQNPDEKKNVQIAFRQGTPARLRVLVLDQRRIESDKPSDPVPQRLRAVADEWQNVLHPCSEIGTTLFSRNAWAKREISFVFDDKGRPQKVERVSGSNALALASSLSSAAAGLRDELAATTSKAVQIEADRRTLEMGDLTTRLETLKKEKDVFDAQLKLDEAGVNREAAMRQQQAAADLAQLQAEINLKAAQDVKAQATELASLRTSLELLKQQLEVLKAQQALKDAQK